MLHYLAGDFDCLINEENEGKKMLNNYNVIFHLEDVFAKCVQIVPVNLGEGD